NLAGHEGRLVGGKEDDRAGDLVRLADAAERPGRNEASLSLRRSGETVEHAGLCWTGGHRVDAHAKGGGFERRGLRHTFHGVLAGRVDCRAASARVAVNR